MNQDFLKITQAHSKIMIFKNSNIKLLTFLCLSLFIHSEDERMTSLTTLIQGEDWVKNNKTQLYIMERCLAINAGLSTGTRTEENKKMIEESSKKADWFLSFAVNLYNSIYKSTELREEYEVSNLIIKRSGEMFVLYMDYMQEDYLLSGNPYGEPLMGDRDVCDALYNLDRIE